MRTFLDEAGGSDKEESMDVDRDSDEENERILTEMEEKVEELAKEEKAEVKRWEHKITIHYTVYLNS